MTFTAIGTFFLFYDIVKCIFKEKLFACLCSTFTFCLECKSVFSRQSEHCHGNARPIPFRVCIQHGWMGRSANMVMCGGCRGKVEAPTKYEVNYSFEKFLNEFVEDK